MIYYFAYCLFTILSWIFFPLTVLGRENIPSSGEVIIASNHLSNLDPFIIGVASKRKLNYVAKEELFRNKILGYVLKRLEAIPIKRNTSDFQALREILRRLKRKSPIVLFPEGTRTLDASKRKINPGVGFIAVKSGVTIIPAFVSGSEKVLSPKKFMMKRHPVTVVFGKPLNISPNHSYQEIATQIMEEILSIKST
jgi:1-acyl-sn-glycerol-3-phosphate acyltransferase